MVLLTGLLYINIGLSVVIILKSSQEYLVNAGVPQGTIFDPMLFPLLMSFLMMLTNIVFYADVQSTLCVVRSLICVVNSQSRPLKLNLICRTLCTRVGIGFFDFITSKSQFFLFGHSNKCDAIDVKICLTFIKNHRLRYLDCLFLVCWVGTVTLSLLPKLLPGKLKSSFVL